MRQCCFESFQLLGHEAVVRFELQGFGFQLHGFGGIAGAEMGFGGGVEIGGVGGGGGDGFLGEFDGFVEPLVAAGAEPGEIVLGFGISGVGGDDVLQVFVGGVETFFGVFGFADVVQGGDDVGGKVGIFLKDLAEAIEFQQFLQMKLNGSHVVGGAGGAEVVPMHLGPGVVVGPGEDFTETSGALHLQAGGMVESAFEIDGGGEFVAFFTGEAGELEVGIHGLVALRKPKGDLEFAACLGIPALIDEEATGLAMRVGGETALEDCESIESECECRAVLAMEQAGHGVDQLGLIEIGAIGLEIVKETGEGAVLGVKGEQVCDGGGHGLLIAGGAGGLLAQEEQGVGKALVFGCQFDQPIVGKIELAVHGGGVFGVDGDGLRKEMLGAMDIHVPPGPATNG